MIQIDMKMPKTCRECQFEIDHRRCFITGESIVMRGPFGRPDSCPLHPLDDEILDDDKIHVGDEVCFNDGESFKAVVLDAVAMRPIDGDKLKEAVKYSESMYIGYLNHCAEAGYDPSDKDLVEATIKWHENMLKLIDTSPTIEMQRDHSADICKKGGMMSCKAVYDALECMNFASERERKYAYSLLEQIPTAEPEVIRCKDCKFWETTWAYGSNANLHYCPLVDGVRREDFYCADAEERRTDD